MYFYKEFKTHTMLYVKITKEEALKLGSRQYGLTSGKRKKETGCTNW